MGSIALLALPDSVPRHARLLSPRRDDGNGEPGRGQARRRPAQAIQRTGTAIGEVYAWGMVGSIIGTFLTGLRADQLSGHEGSVLVLGTCGLLRDFFGPTWHAIWAGIPLGLCVLAFTPPGSSIAPSSGPADRRRHRFEKWEPSGGCAKSRPTRKPRRIRLGRREQLLLHQGQQRAGGQRRARSGPWCSTT